MHTFAAFKHCPDTVWTQWVCGATQHIDMCTCQPTVGLRNSELGCDTASQSTVENVHSVHTLRTSGNYVVVKILPQRWRTASVRTRLLKQMLRAAQASCGRCLFGSPSLPASIVSPTLSGAHLSCSVWSQTDRRYVSDRLWSLWSITVVPSWQRHAEVPGGG